MDEKNNRHNTLSKLLEKQSFSSQAAIVNEMQGLGFEVTQPSISRDFRELGVAKVDGRYTIAPYTSASSKRGFERFINAILPAGPNLLVIKTKAGAANVVGAMIDEMKHDSIVGTVAGDDTIFVATESKIGQKTAINAIQNLSLSKPAFA